MVKRMMVEAFWTFYLLEMKNVFGSLHTLKTLDIRLYISKLFLQTFSTIFLYK